jgi:hypothetical protein
MVVRECIYGLLVWGVLVEGGFFEYRCDVLLIPWVCLDGIDAI